ncbi:RNA-directed DNA polymerase from mobile element jockey [Araneus ventricosus]|uniref:RNA-directed DNA polymerase from mobile element jockey n=1 Tax=Araneus ventricosus TaxID=182803 RepID=A0A4Y2T7E9_ARAVE|nr:RNA-directed DNA polymerase from mobile element jockey [Araneus ventricosus]
MQGLLEGDQHWYDTLNEAIQRAPFQLRLLFATICGFGEVKDIPEQWFRYKDALSEDFVRQYSEDSGPQYALAEIGEFLNLFSRKDENIPTVSRTILGPVTSEEANSIKGASTNAEKAEVIADHFVQQFQINDIGNPSTENTVKTSIENFDPTAPTLKYRKVRLSEITEYIKNTKINKAPGIDGITNKMLKNLPLKILIKLANLYNYMFKLKYFPHCWKTARILPILNPGKDPTKPISYRPISLLPTLSKLGEKLILTRYLKHARRIRIPIPQQFGFTPKLSTTHQLLRVVEYILEGKSSKLITAAIFLDIAKAFDKVWTQGLIHKLISYNFPHYIIAIIQSYLQDRHFTVSVNNTDSTPRTISACVPQGGGILAPIIFLCFMNDIPKQKNITLSLYADDTAIIAQGKTPQEFVSALQSYIKNHEIWLTSWKIQLNVDKTEAIIFSRISNCPVVHLFGTPIPWKNEVKYLGVTLDRGLTFKSHIDRIREKFNDSFRRQYSLICRNSKLSLNNKLLIYLAYLRPILAYASPVWACTAKTHLHKLEVLENKTIRMITNARWYHRNTDLKIALNIPSLKEFIQKLARKFFNNIQNIDNSTLQKIPYYDGSLQTNRKRPRSILFR